MNLATLPVEVPRSRMRADERAAYEALTARARQQASCPACRGYGWHAREGLPAAGETHADHVLVCACPAGDRFWKLALDDIGGLLRCMDLDRDGRIASVDGLYGRFGANDPRLLRALATTRPSVEASRRSVGAGASQ